MIYEVFCIRILKIILMVVQYEGGMKLGEECVCHAYFTNPVPLALTRGWFIVQGAGLTDIQFIRLKE